MPDCRFANFDIAVHGQAAPYLVHALYAGHSAEGELAVDRHAGDWAQRLGRLGAAARPPGQAFLEETGALLYAALWREQVRDLWLRSRSDLESGAIDGLRVRLSLSPPDVAALPWEALYDVDRGAVFAAGASLTLVRVVNLLRYVGPPRPLATHLPLRILAAIPEDPTGQVDAEAEWLSLQAALAPLQGGGVEAVRLGGRCGLWELRRQLERLQPDVLHVVTHGRPDGIVLWQEGEPQLVPAAALRVALDGANSLRLLLLAACATAQAVDTSPLASLGSQLLQTGVPAVIAMQYDVRAAAAAAFGEQFYQQLVAGRCAGQVDVAVNYGRSALYIHDPDSFAYGTPVLWLNAADGRIFVPARPFVLRPPAVSTAAAAKPGMTGAEIAAALGELAEFEAWLGVVPQFERSAVPSALRSIETRRQEHLRTLRDLLSLVAAEEDPAARAQGFVQRRAALGVERDHAVRLTAFLQANTPGSSTVT
ncbi:MAG: CHAT domain-containing protein [Caldilineaceae bacterium]